MLQLIFQNIYVLNLKKFTQVYLHSDHVHCLPLIKGVQDILRLILCKTFHLLLDCLPKIYYQLLDLFFAYTVSFYHTRICIYLLIVILVWVCPPTCFDTFLYMLPKISTLYRRVLLNHVTKTDTFWCSYRIYLFVFNNPLWIFVPCA